MFKKYYFLLFLAIVLINCAKPQDIKTSDPKTPQNPHLQTFTKKYIDQFQTILKDTKTPGTGLVIIRDTLVLHLAGYGTKEVNSSDSVDVNTVFRVGSLSKGFASILVGILVEKGDLNWTDKVNHHLPEFVLKDTAQTERVNLVHLLSQTSGLPYHAYTNLVEAGMDMRSIAKELKKVKLISKEGEIYAYQNAAFSLIGSIMEEVLAQNLTQIFEENLFQPLQVKNTTTDYESLINAPNIAWPHSGNNGNWRKRKISKKYYNAIPAGGINASIADMGEWVQLLLGNRPNIISQKTLDEVFKARINTKNRRRYFGDWPMVENAYYGMGWRVLTNKRDTFIYHGGYVNGYRGEILIYPKEKLGICVLTNAPSDLPNKAMPLFLKTYTEKRDSIIAWEKREQIKVAVE